MSGARGEGAFWTAESRVADGRVERERLGNGLLTDHVYEPETGRVQRILTGSGTASTIQSVSYDWDLRGNLRSRADQNLAVTETFGYDPSDRLRGATSTQTGTLELRYDATGNLTYKTGHGAYLYPPPGSPRPHAVLATAATDAASPTTRTGICSATAPGRTLVWSASNELLAVGQAGSRRQLRVPRLRTRGRAADAARDRHVPTGASTYVVQLGSLYESATDLRSGRVKRRHMIYADGALVAVHTASQGAAGTRYVHRDHLESTQA